MLFKKRKQKERHNLWKKVSGNCKTLKELFQNSPSKGKDHANYELIDFEPGASCSNELVDSSNIISYTNEGDNASPKKIYWDTSFDWGT